MMSERNRRSAPWPKRLQLLLGLTLTAAMLVGGCASSARKVAPDPAPAPIPGPGPTPNPKPPSTPNPSTPPTTTTPPTSTAPSPPTGSDSGPAPSGVHPKEHRLGEPKVDAVIDAYMKQDVDRLMKLTGSTGNVTYGTCEATKADSTEQIRSKLTEWVEAPRYLYAVYSDLSTNGFYLLFANGLDDNATRTVNLNAAGQITHLGMGCDFPDAVVTSNHSPLLPPKSTGH